MKTQLANPVICTNYRVAALARRRTVGAMGEMGDAAPAARTPFTIEYLLSARGSAGSPPPPSGTPTSPPRPTAQPGDKPAQSYIALISTAILSSPEKKLLLSDIYQWIMDKYPYFKNKVGGEGGWGGPWGLSGGLGGGRTHRGSVGSVPWRCGHNSGLCSAPS